MLDRVINKKTAMEIFEQEAILIGDRDGMPTFKAKEFLGADAVEFPNNFRGDNKNSYWIGDDRHIEYLTQKGFLIAVTYRNVCLLQKEKALSQQDA